MTTNPHTLTFAALADQFYHEAKQAYMEGTYVVNIYPITIKVNPHTLTFSALAHQFYHEAKQAYMEGMYLRNKNEKLCIIV